jgi:hypothetical protein
MKIAFTGWGHNSKEHFHPVRAVTRAEGGGYHAGTDGDPVKWNGPRHVCGQVKDLQLNGAYLVEVAFEQQELRSWLERYIDEDPAAAVRLFAEMQAAALLAAATKAQASKVT